MSAITLINAITETPQVSAEFSIFQGGNCIARVPVHAGGQARVPTTTHPVDDPNDPVVQTAEQWEAWAIINGITTERVTITDPNATITASGNNNDDGYSLVVS